MQRCFVRDTNLKEIMLINNRVDNVTDIVRNVRVGGHERVERVIRAEPAVGDSGIRGRNEKDASRKAADEPGVCGLANRGLVRVRERQKVVETAQPSSRGGG